ncbi:amino acid ABC transporter permease [Caballeronia sordidicola]|uniref:Polar amino acid ABC transporter, inner membrane subunit n=1 Tax=Caballeronia sordidicola TaxID=196367 RepID=A0A226X1B6_CABSO|nr:amino acid ABC transporter permease [Caballeronia sordidicola]OXC76780.1 polar amino acid ABC transporter, inner membrane subunit [Caballeronia sordidicola]
MASYTFDFSFLNSYRVEIMHGVVLTVVMSCIAMALGLAVGIAAAIARVYGPPPLRRATVVYIEGIRNTPLIIQVFWIFFGLAILHVRLSAFVAAVIALAINVGAYTAEIIRAGLNSIHRGQVEAASCLALSRRQTVFHVMLPQALERMYPALISQFILLMLASSLMSQISVDELTGAGYMIQSFTFRGFEVYLVIAVVYLVLAVLLRMSCAALALFIFPRRRRLNRG